jgi:hypothetical protein
MTGNEADWGAGISTISQNFSKSPSTLFYPLESSISQSPEGSSRECVALRGRISFFSPREFTLQITCHYKNLTKVTR